MRSWSTVVNESSRTALKCALHCDCSAKTETGKLLKRGYQILKILLLLSRRQNARNSHKNDRGTENVRSCNKLQK